MSPLCRKWPRNFRGWWTLGARLIVPARREERNSWRSEVFDSRWLRRWFALWRRNGPRSAASACGYSRESGPSSVTAMCPVSGRRSIQRVTRCRRCVPITSKQWRTRYDRLRKGGPPPPPDGMHDLHWSGRHQPCHRGRRRAREPAARAAAARRCFCEPPPRSGPAASGRFLRWDGDSERLSSTRVALFRPAHASGTTGCGARARIQCAHESRRLWTRHAGALSGCAGRGVRSACRAEWKNVYGTFNVRVPTTGISPRRCSGCEAPGVRSSLQEEVCCTRAPRRR